MFDRYVVQETKIITPPDRLLTEMYKDERQRQYNRFEMLKKYTHDTSIEDLEKLLYKHTGDNFIFGDRHFKRKDIEDYIEWRKTEWL